MLSPPVLSSPLTQLSASQALSSERTRVCQVARSLSEASQGHDDLHQSNNALP